jgi:hypothetical protein
MKIRGIPRFIPWFLGKNRGIPWYFLSGGTQLYSAEEGSLVKYWCNSPGTMVRKLPAYMTEILLGKGVK